MKEIICPNCHHPFKIDETGYNEIVSQIRDEKFKEELDERLKQAQLNEQKDKEVALLKAKQENEAQVRDLEEKLKKADNELQLSKKSSELELQKALQDKQMQIIRLQGEAEKAKVESANSIKEALSSKQGEVDKLNNQLLLQKKEAEIQQTSQKEAYEGKLKDKDEEIEHYKDMKMRLSTKLVGESLEQHCLTEFNRIRPLAFPTAYFEKDNDIKTGSKGDFIYKEDKDGVELLSIMFEMKNENEETASKHKNEDFFKELDKDRKEKNCEYAVLVSMLEPDSELYNGGIVDVSYRYEKMYVIRPQFFLSIISLLRNGAMGSFEYKKKLLIEQTQQADVTHFEEKLHDFQEAFSRNYGLAQDGFNKAIEEIDKTIDHLNKIKDALTKSGNNLRLANNKAQDLTIKKLVHDNPTMKESFEEARLANKPNKPE